LTPNCFVFEAITFCVIGQACSNVRLLTALDDRYAYECIHNDDEILRKFSETKHLLSKRQLRIYVIQSFDEHLFTSLKEDENSYIISAELVLTCAEKKIVCELLSKRTCDLTVDAINSRIYPYQDEIDRYMLNICLHLLFVLLVAHVEKFT
jgi:hypothetical protein